MAGVVSATGVGFIPARHRVEINGWADTLSVANGATSTQESELP